MNADEQDEYHTYYDERRSHSHHHSYLEFRSWDYIHYNCLIEFIERYSLKICRYIETGSSGCIFHDMFENYWGTDIDHSLAEYRHKPYTQVATEYWKSHQVMR